jgi:hypothetical protein
VPPIADPPVPERVRSHRHLGAVVAALGAGGAAVGLFTALAGRTTSGNSDSATVLLEGRAIASGHVLLGGWTLSLDSFWTIDALANALGVAIAGLSPILLRAVPIAIAALVVAIAFGLATWDLHRHERVLAAVVALSVLAFPSRAWSLFFLEGPYHVGTACYCLLGFAALRSGRFGVGWAVGVLVLAAAVLGDFQAVILGVAPVTLGGVVAARREERVTAGLPLLVAAAAALGIALVARAIVTAAGGYTLARANPHASLGQIARNVGLAPRELLDLLGVTSGPYGPSGVPAPLAALHLLIVATLLAAVLAALWKIARTARTPDGAAMTPSDGLDTLLLLGVLGDCACFVLLPITSSDAYARYLTAGILFATVLAARTVPRWALLRTPRGGLVARAIALVVLVVAAGSFGLSLRGPGAVTPASTLAAFLEKAGLHSGIGDYWSASIVTVESHGTVAVRPVIEDTGHLVRYTKQSDRHWYAGAQFSFYVFNRAAPWNGDTATPAIRTFGRPSRSYAVGTYLVLVWDRPITVGVNGSAGP